MASGPWLAAGIFCAAFPFGVQTPARHRPGQACCVAITAGGAANVSSKSQPHSPTLPLTAFKLTKLGGLAARPRPRLARRRGAAARRQFWESWELRSFSQSAL